MQSDFHYYATYCAACLVGYTPEESLAICYSDNLVDSCSKDYLSNLHAPLTAATTQRPIEMLNARTDPVALQDIRRIWASFHFLPYDLYADAPRGSKRYQEKYRLICGPNGELVADTVRLAKKGQTLQAVGVAMHVLCDTWAHRYFAGTPSLVINNISRHFYEIVGKAGEQTERPMGFRHTVGLPDDLEAGLYKNTPYQPNENTTMNLGHGRAGHLPDYSCMRYRYLPAWNDYEEVVKDNPAEYYQAFCQMVYALAYLRGTYDTFETERYDTELVAPWKDVIQGILEKRQLDACEDWRALGERISGVSIEEFDAYRYHDEYFEAQGLDKEQTFLGKFILAAMAQKSMVTNRIYVSGNYLAGRSIEFAEKGFGGIKDYARLVRHYGIGVLR